MITLDTDTQLPRDAARQFVGAMAHPLNAPHFGKHPTGADKDVVTSGYGILQPRVTVSLPCTNRSLYARLFGGEAGVDPYTRTVSDVYQDVFGEGSFIGKGIYDVDAFERALKGRFPANRILSHDLLEGCYARAGLLSDAELQEEYPARYSADVDRRRRWIRGDWQLAGWLRRRVKGPDGSRERNPLSMLSQWKLFDNLRRSLVPAALTVLLLLGWTVLSPAWLWTEIVVGILLAPSLIAAFSDLVDKPDDVRIRQHLAAVEIAARRHAWQALLALAFLPYETYYSLDAIIRTVGRMLFTHRRLLEWNPSSDASQELELSGRTSLFASYRSMVVAPAAAAIVGIGLAITHPLALPVAAPILLLWGGAPAIAWWVSRPLARRSARLALDQLRFLRKLARKLGRTSRRTSARTTIGCRPTTCRKVRRSASRIGLRRPISDCPCSPIWLRTTLATFRRGISSSARRMRSTRWRCWRDIGDISTTGTTRRRGCLWRLSTCRRWIAEISPATF